MDTEKLKAVTGAPNEPALYYSEQQKQIGGKSAIQRLKGTGALAATALLATSLLLGACGDDDDDCIVTTPPTNVPVNVVLPPIATPTASGSTSTTPSTPSSSQFTSGSSTGNAQTYCQSRRTGIFYWYSGTRYYSSSGS